MRSSVLSVREQDYVTAARALGDSPFSILRRRVIPNAITPLIVQGTLGVGAAVLEVAALSFIGLAAQAPTAEWGTMIGLERNQLFTSPFLIFIPGIALTLTVLGFNLLGDGLRDAFDPRLSALSDRDDGHRRRPADRRALDRRKRSSRSSPRVAAPPRTAIRRDPARRPRTCGPRSSMREGTVRAVTGIDFSRPARRDPGPGRRVRLRQERHLAVDHAVSSPRPADRGRRGHVRRPGPAAS